MDNNSPPPPFVLAEDPNDNAASLTTFLTPNHPSFDECRQCSYAGLEIEAASQLPHKFHKRFRKSLTALENHGSFLFDYTQPRGADTPVVRTRVRRCLVGEPGITYFYLGIRMFAHPWSGQHSTLWTRRIHKVSRQLQTRAHNIAVSSSDLQQTDPKKNPKCAFNLTLINRMDPQILDNGCTTTKRVAKPEPIYNMGPCSVSWHADSSLLPFSTISVYVAHHLKEQSSGLPLAPDTTNASSNTQQPWQVAVRRTPYVEGPPPPPKDDTVQTTQDNNNNNKDTTTPALAIPIHDGDIYHMTGSFNHHHQHAVLQGHECVRYSSTHRVGATESHTVPSVLQNSRAVLMETTTTVQQFQHEQSCLNELEFDWIRQWYVQGEKHSHQLGSYWNDKIVELEGLWLQLEQRTLARLEQLRTGDAANSGEHLERIVVLLGALMRRRRLRLAWAARVADPLLVRECPPIPCLFQVSSTTPRPLPEDLSDIIAELEAIKAACSKQRKKSKPCRFFVKFGNCTNGENCPFSHELTAPPPRTAEPVVRVSDSQKAAEEWPFPDTDFGDHYETPKIAYAHVKPLLKRRAKALGVQNETLRLYDPYYCRGRVVNLLKELGFSSVIHEKRDFYADIAAGAVPEHDVLLTNPPYSSDHKKKLFRFLLEQQRTAGETDAPFLLLLPAWSASKLGWRQFLWCLLELRKGRVDVTFQDAERGERATRVGAFSERLEEKAGCFFVCPPERYQFVAAVESRQEAPFDGIWFCGGWRDSQKILKSFQKSIAKQKAKGKGSATVCRSLTELRATKLLPTEDEKRLALDEDQVERRKRALIELDKARRSNPAWIERKRRKATESRDEAKVLVGYELDEKAKESVLANPKVCRHFFGLTSGGGGGGCTRGESCRFLHNIP